MMRAVNRYNDCLTKAVSVTNMCMLLFQPMGNEILCMKFYSSIRQKSKITATFWINFELKQITIFKGFNSKLILALCTSADDVFYFDKVS